MIQVAEAKAVERAKEGLGAVILLLLVVSLPAFTATNRFKIGPLYWDNWPIFVLTALLVPFVLLALHGLVRGGMWHRSGRLALAVAGASLAVMLGWWIFLFLQPMVLHMVTRNTAEYELVSQGEYQMARAGSYRAERLNCPVILASNPDLGDFQYCVAEDQINLFGTAGQVVRLRVEVSPFATWVVGLPERVSGVEQNS